MKKILFSTLIISIGIFVILFQLFPNETSKNSDQSLDKIKKTQLNISSLFNIYGFEDQFEIIDGKKRWTYVKFELNPDNELLYEKLRYSPDENTIVVYPFFTSVAYAEPGFYTYFRGECDEECLTLKIPNESPLNFFSSGNAFQVLQLLEYPSISDIELDQNLAILEQYDKVILLHNEYVTKKYLMLSHHILK